MVVGISIWILLLVLLLLSAVFSAAEASMLAVNKVRLRHLVEQGNRTARLIYDLLPKVDRVIGTLLVANNLTSAAVATVLSWVCVSVLGPEEGLVVATLGGATILLIIGDVTPKLFAVSHPEVVLFAAVRPLRWLMIVLYPVATLFTWIGRSILRVLRVPARRRSALITEEELKVMIQMGREAGVLDEQELRMLQRIFEFSDSVVAEIMVPRREISAVELTAKAADALDVLIEEGHARIPVYQGSLDEVVGVIYARDLLAMVRHGGLFVLQDLVRPILTTHEHRRAAELLVQFQREKIQIAIVRDAHGTTVGLVTIEDLLEELVGEIAEEPRR